MKKYILKFKFLTVATLSIVFGSCEDLDVGSEGTIAQETFYADANTLEPGIIGIYGTMHRNIWALDNYAHYAGADDVTTQPGLNKDVIRESDQFARSNGNSWSTNDYNGNYKTILGCNSFIANAHPVGVSEVVLNAAQANAYFMRAICYFRLTTTFGDIPMPLTPAPDLEIPLTPMREVMGQVIEDLKFAAKWAVNVRDANPLVQDGHVSKAAANAFLAKAYMQLTGYPFNETDKWDMVKDLTKPIVNGGIYSLNDDFAHCFQNPHQVNKEMIFAHIMNVASWPITTQNRVYGNRFADWGDLYMEWKYYLNFPEGYRKQFSTASVGNKYFALYNNPIITKFTWGTKKGNSTDPVGEVFENAWQTSNDRAAMRMSEVMLMYAESCANTGETTEAIEMLNRVKRRAFAKGSTKQAQVAALPAGFWKIADAAVDYTASQLSSKDAIVRAIVKERSFEFLGEVGGNYWLDLVRLEMVAEANANRDSRDIPLIGSPADKKQWFTPIPATETTLNPNLIK